MADPSSKHHSHHVDIELHQNHDPLDSLTDPDNPKAAVTLIEAEAGCLRVLPARMSGYVWRQDL